MITWLTISSYLHVLYTIVHVYEFKLKRFRWKAYTQYHVQTLYVSCVIFCLSVQQTKKSTFGGSSKHTSPPALYPWLNRFKNLLLSKVSSPKMQFLSSENLLCLSKRFQVNVICTDHKSQSHFLSTYRYWLHRNLNDWSETSYLFRCSLLRFHRIHVFHLWFQFSIYFYDILQRQSSPPEMKSLISKTPDDFVTRYHFHISR